MNLHQINPDDFVATDLDTGHKVALRDIAAGENVIKYGFPIGHATRDIKKGERVHTDNLATNLKDKLEYNRKTISSYRVRKRCVTRWNSSRWLPLRNPKSISRI